MTALRDWGRVVPGAPPPESPAVAGEPRDGADALAVRVGAERQRIAFALHDEVAPLLFGMTSRVRRALDEHRAAPDLWRLAETLQQLQDDLRLTQEQLRTVIRDCRPLHPVETLPATTQRDVDAFAERTGIEAHLVLRGPVDLLPVAVERVVSGCVRQALVNIERHAGATTAVVTLDYRPDGLVLVVQDDGLGLSSGFAPPVVPLDGQRWGFTSMVEQVERLGGSVLLRRADEGGTLLRIHLPVSP